MTIHLFLTSIIIILCVFFNKVSNKSGIPVILNFILLGMFFGSDGLVKIPFDNYIFAEKISSVALIFIMFYGGFGTRWSEARPVAVKAVLLSSLGVVFTAVFVSLFCHFILKINFLESFLIGSVISSTDAATVFNILRSKKLNLKYNTASMLEIESGSNDPFAYMMTAIAISLIKGQINKIDIIYLLFSQIIYGVIIGVIIASISSYLLKKYKFSTSGFGAIFVVAIVLLTYSVPSFINGNGYLSVYIVGIILGNQEFKSKIELIHFFNGTTGLLQMSLFFLLGLLSTPSKMKESFEIALYISIFLLIIARPLAVSSILTPLKSKFNQQLIVSWCGLRGASSIVFAIIAKINISNGSHDIFHIVFLIVLFSILIQGYLLPIISKKSNMIDENENVLKTFNDYSDEMSISFIEIKLSKYHKWIGLTVKNIIFPPETILVLVYRNNKIVIPRGDTILLENDKLILSAKALGQIEGIHISEKYISKNDPLVNVLIKDMPKKENKLVIMIKRKGDIIIPRGDTLIKDNDILVINYI